MGFGPNSDPKGPCYTVPEGRTSFAGMQPRQPPRALHLEGLLTWLNAPLLLS